MRCIELTGSDTRLDCGESFTDYLNPIPQRCEDCGFPNFDGVPQPYRLQKSRAMVSNEAAPAAYGNILVRERVRRVLGIVVPDACSFYPTVLGKEGLPSPWSLAVPRQSVRTSIVKASVPRCTECGEPRSAHGSQRERWLLGTPSDAPHDVFRAAEGISSEKGWKHWSSNDLFMSSRLFGLLERLGVKGLDECTSGSGGKKLREKEFKDWIDERVGMLEAAGIAMRTPGTLSPAVVKQFKNYLKQTASDAPTSLDRKAVEKRLKVKLPPSVIDYFGVAGARSFYDVDQQEGFTANILPPDQWDFETYRQFDNGDGPTIDGVMFATTDHGDCFCLDLSADGKELPVYQYQHEGGFLEPYTESFAECILRFASAENDGV